MWLCLDAAIIGDQEVCDGRRRKASVVATQEADRSKTDLVHWSHDDIQDGETLWRPFRCDVRLELDAAHDALWFTVSWLQSFEFVFDRSNDLRYMSMLASLR